MRLTGLVVCVDYADLFARGVARWKAVLDRLIVITTPGDDATLRLCAEHGVETFTTDVFYANGAAFNKGAALSECERRLGLIDAGGWLVAFDSDIVPPTDLRERLIKADIAPGTLYGSPRFQVDEDGPLELDRSKKMPQGWVIGFFMLFHATDPHLTRPLFDVSFPHAGSYDTVFCNQWPKSHQAILPLDMLHLGDERRNWFGRYRRDDMDRMLLARRISRDPHAWEFERMQNPPVIESHPASAARAIG